MIGQVFSLIRAPFVAFVGGFLVVAGWIWAPQLSRLLPSLFMGGPSVSMFATNRIGRPEAAPVLRSCIMKIMDLGGETRLDPSQAYFILKAGSMQASASAMLGKSNLASETQSIYLANAWGELANCIYAQDDRALCDPDNRAAAVESTTKFFSYAKQREGSTGKSAVSAADARVIEGFSDRLLIMLKNHRRYGTLVAADFGSFAPAEILRIMREEKETRDICKR